jgi:hypothetical protein
VGLCTLLRFALEILTQIRRAGPSDGRHEKYRFDGGPRLGFREGSVDIREVEGLHQPV